MTETQFIENNKAQWQALEKLLKKKKKDPDQLHRLFVKVSSDLAYASTFYPKRSVRAYLNQLTQQVFDSMEEKQREWSLDGVKTFFRETLPREMYRSRLPLLTSFLIFAIAVLIGIISSAHNPDFPSIILGDQYVQMTEQNINDGDPMKVYKDMEQGDMFFMITVNNIRVSMFCFLFGIFGGVGSAIFLLYNGIMVGAFQYFFYANGLFLTSFFTIWIHGTIEISAIIIAGAAGLVLGNGILFPKTYSRSASLQISAKRSIRILLGTTPLFVIAGFLESFVTRLTDMPIVIKALIIGLSLLFIIGLYVVYPWYTHRGAQLETEEDLLPHKAEALHLNIEKHRSFSENLALSLSQFRAYFGSYSAYALLPLSGIFLTAMVIYQELIRVEKDYILSTTTLTSLPHGGLLMYAVFWLTTSYALLLLSMIYRSVDLSSKQRLAYIKYYLPVIMTVTLLPVTVWFFAEWYIIIGLFLLIPPQVFFKMAHEATESGWQVWGRLSEIYSAGMKCWLTQMGAIAVILVFHYLLSTILSSDLMSLIWDFVYWHELLEGQFVVVVLITTLMYFVIYLLLLPMYFYSAQNIWHSTSAKEYATDLWNRFESFQTQSPIFESEE